MRWFENDPMSRDVDKCILKQKKYFNEKSYN